MNTTHTPLAYDSLPAPADPRFVALVEREVCAARVRALELWVQQRRERQAEAKRRQRRGEQRPRVGMQVGSPARRAAKLARLDVLRAELEVRRVMAEVVPSAEQVELELFPDVSTVVDELRRGVPEVVR